MKKQDGNLMKILRCQQRNGTPRDITMHRRSSVDDKKNEFWKIVKTNENIKKKKNDYYTSWKKSQNHEQLIEACCDVITKENEHLEYEKRLNLMVQIW